MDEALWHRMEVRFWTALPTVVAAVLAVLSAAPPGGAGLPGAMPFLPAVAVFHWSVYRPDLLPRGAVFGVGLLHDALSGAPFGVSAVALLALQFVAVGQRRLFAGRGPLAVWLGFAALAAAAAAVSWLAASLWHAAPVPAAPVAVQACMTAAFYPLAAWPFAALQRELAPAAELRR